MSTFGRWLAAQDERTDEVGELARAWAADTTHGNIHSPSGFSKRIATWDEVEGLPATETAMGWLARAQAEHIQSRAGSPPAAEPSGLAALQARLDGIATQVTWLVTVIGLALPEAAEAAGVLSDAVTEMEPDDWQAMFEAADFEADPETASA